MVNLCAIIKNGTNTCCVELGKVFCLDVGSFQLDKN